MKNIKNGRKASIGSSLHDKKSFVNPKSLKYLKNKRGDIPVEEILLIKAEISKQKKNLLKGQLQHEHNPKITKYARKLKRKGTVFSRLYEDGQRRVNSPKNPMKSHLHNPLQEYYENGSNRNSSPGKHH